MMRERFGILRHFVMARWVRRFRSRRRLESWQQAKLDGFLKTLVEECPFYRGRLPRLEDLPLIDKAVCRRHFQELNAAGIALEEAEAVALAAEKDRDFSSVLAGGLTVGLSSGTSGERGVFLVSPQDRWRWAGIVLARALSTDSLKHLLSPWRPRLKIAFFLRANSNLYQTIASRRIDFRYFDLLESLATLAPALHEYQPDILIAPATVLAELAKEDALALRPKQVISVAEVLDERDAEAIRSKFKAALSQLYQATEGFIAYTCREGRLHLNEEFLHAGCEWLDETKTRFHPIITDFSRRSQSFVRYRLDDILHADDTPCPCGNASRVIRRIEGRADEVLWFGGAPLFPDVIRQLLYALPVAVDRYRIEQRGNELHLIVDRHSPALESAITGAFHALFEKLRLPPPLLRFPAWSEQAPGEKQRRIRCLSRPLTPP